MINMSDDMLEKKLISVSVEALKKTGVSLGELACTLVFFVTDGKNLICGNLGDGKIFQCDVVNRVLFHGETGKM